MHFGLTIGGVFMIVVIAVGFFWLGKNKPGLLGGVI